MFVIEKFSKIGKSIFNLTVSMNPFLAIFTLYPFFSINISIISCVDIDLVAVVAVLIVFVSVATIFAEPAELVFSEFPS